MRRTEILQKNKAMRGEMEKRLIYGGSDFIQRVNKKFKVEALIKRRGRPKKQTAI